MRHFTNEGKIKAAEQALRMLQDEIWLQNKIWTNYNEFLELNRTIPGKELFCRDVEGAMEYLEAEIMANQELVESLEAFIGRKGGAW